MPVAVESSFEIAPEGCTKSRTESGSVVTGRPASIISVRIIATRSKLDSIFVGMSGVERYPSRVSMSRVINSKGMSAGVVEVHGSRKTMLPYFWWKSSSEEVISMMGG